LHLEKLASRSVLHPPYINFQAEVGMPEIMNFQIIADMGRMNG
jgi:hypothetical protein